MSGSYPQENFVQHAMNVRHQRLKLFALIAVFALPMVTAWVMVQWRIGIPEQRTAHGELAPAVPVLAEWPLEERQATLDGGDWILAFDCSRECSVKADRWWRLHRALGREAPRVSRLRIGGEQAALPGETVTQWRELPEWQDTGRVWLLDPHGRAVLTYTQDVSQRDVFDDLGHLLKRNPDPRAVTQLDGESQ